MIDRESVEHEFADWRGESYRRMAFNLPLEDDDPEHPWPPYAVETMWVEALGEERYRVDNIPFFVKPLAVNDIVRGHPSDSNSAVVWFSDRLEWSGRSTVRVIFFSHADQILDALVAMGCSYERLRQIVAVDIPSGAVVDQVHAFLSGKQASGDLDLEEACIPDRFLR